MTKATDMEKQIVDDWNNDVNSPVTIYLKNKGITGEAIHLGKKQYVGWKQYSNKPKKTYGKTDIKIDNYKISVKTVTEHIIMSAKKDEALNTFFAVSEQLFDGKISQIVSDLSDDISDLVTSGVSPQNILKSRKSKDRQIIDGDKKHQELLSRISDVFDDPVFYSYFIREALSGELKFGSESDGSATHLLNINDDIPSLHSVDDMSFIRKMADSVIIRVDFKTSRKVQGPERGMYRFWSVIQLINKTIITDSIMYESFVSRVRSIISEILTFLKRKIYTWKDIFDFLEVEPVITVTFKG
jgi:hypothetical protein